MEKITSENVFNLEANVAPLRIISMNGAQDLGDKIQGHLLRWAHRCGKDVEDFSIIIAYLEMLRVSMLEMDIDGMDKAMENLQAFRFPEDIESNVRKLSIYVTNMDIEQANILIETLIGQCEQLE